MKNAENRVFLLTGCASGIGWHLLHCLAERNAKILATDVDIEKLCALVAVKGWTQEQVVTQALDVRKPEQWAGAVDAAVRNFGRVDVLMNIAGVTLARPIHEATTEQIDFHLDINAKGMMYGAQAVSRIMVAQGSGHIINFSSIAGLVAVPRMSLYSASKFAVRGFSLAIANDLAPHGVTVTAVYPDAVDTPMLEGEAREEHSTYSFAGNGILSVRDIERAIFDKVLPRRPREIIIAGSGGFLARWICAYPALFDLLLPYYERQGRKARERYRKKTER